MTVSNKAYHWKWFFQSSKGQLDKKRVFSLLCSMLLDLLKQPWHRLQILKLAKLVAACHFDELWTFLLFGWAQEISCSFASCVGPFHWHPMIEYLHFVVRSSHSWRSWWSKEDRGNSWLQYWKTVNVRICALKYFYLKSTWPQGQTAFLSFLWIVVTHWIFHY